MLVDLRHTRYDQLSILSRDQLVKRLLVVEAVLNKRLVYIFAGEPNLCKLRKGLQVSPTDSFITWRVNIIRKTLIFINQRLH